MRKGTVFTGFLAAVLTAGLSASCTQDDEAAVQTEQQEKRQTTSVKELTEQLREYNSRVYGKTRGAEVAETETRRGLLDKGIKVAIADANGAIRGYSRGGATGALIGGALFSLLKAAWDNFFPSMSVAVAYPKVIPTGNSFVFRDSVGYYHNMLETRLYNMDNNSQLRTSGELIGRAEGIMNGVSAGFVSAGGLTDLQRAAIAADADAFREIGQTDLPFDDYCALLKRQNPEDGDYIDFTAEYLYIVFYANVDVDEYTEEVLFMINNSNSDVEDAGKLNNCIQIAYASSVLSDNINTNN